MDFPGGFIGGCGIGYGIGEEPPKRKVVWRVDPKTGKNVKVVLGGDSDDDSSSSSEGAKKTGTGDSSSATPASSRRGLPTTMFGGGRPGSFDSSPTPSRKLVWRKDPVTGKHARVVLGGGGNSDSEADDDKTKKGTAISDQRGEKKEAAGGTAGNPTTGRTVIKKKIVRRRKPKQQQDDAVNKEKLRLEIALLEAELEKARLESMLQSREKEAATTATAEQRGPTTSPEGEKGNGAYCSSVSKDLLSSPNGDDSPPPEAVQASDDDSTTSGESAGGGPTDAKADLPPASSQQQHARHWLEDSSSDESSCSSESGGDGDGNLTEVPRKTTTTMAMSVAETPGQAPNESQFDDTSNSSDSSNDDVPTFSCRPTTTRGSTFNEEEDEAEANNLVHSENNSSSSESSDDNPVFLCRPTVTRGSAFDGEDDAESKNDNDRSSSEADSADESSDALGEKPDNNEEQPVSDLDSNVDLHDESESQENVESSPSRQAEIPRNEEKAEGRCLDDSSVDSLSSEEDESEFPAPGSQNVELEETNAEAIESDVNVDCCSDSTSEDDSDSKSEECSASDAQESSLVTTDATKRCATDDSASDSSEDCDEETDRSAGSLPTELPGGLADPVTRDIKPDDSSEDDSDSESAADVNEDATRNASTTSSEAEKQIITGSSQSGSSGELAGNSSVSPQTSELLQAVHHPTTDGDESKSIERSAGDSEHAAKIAVAAKKTQEPDTINFDPNRGTNRAKSEVDTQPSVEILHTPSRGGPKAKVSDSKGINRAGYDLDLSFAVLAYLQSHGFEKAASEMRKVLERRHTNLGKKVVTMGSIRWEPLFKTRIDDSEGSDSENDDEEEQEEEVEEEEEESDDDDDDEEDSVSESEEEEDTAESAPKRGGRCIPGRSKSDDQLPVASETVPQRKVKRSVSFNDNILTQTIPRYTMDEKLDVFYDRTDITSFKFAEECRRSEEQAEMMAAMLQGSLLNQL